MPAITAKPITATPITARPLTAYGLGESTDVSRYYLHWAGVNEYAQHSTWNMSGFGDVVSETITPAAPGTGDQYLWANSDASWGLYIDDSTGDLILDYVDVDGSTARTITGPSLSAGETVSYSIEFAADGVTMTVGATDYTNANTPELGSIVYLSANNTPASYFQGTRENLRYTNATALQGVDAVMGNGVDITGTIPSITLTSATISFWLRYATGDQTILTGSVAILTVASDLFVSGANVTSLTVDGQTYGSETLVNGQDYFVEIEVNGGTLTTIGLMASGGIMGTLTVDVGGSTYIHDLSGDDGDVIPNVDPVTGVEQDVYSDTFDSSDGWSLSDVADITGGVLTFPVTTGVSQANKPLLTVGKRYRVTFDVTRFTNAGAFRVRVGTSGYADLNPNITGVGQYYVEGFVIDTTSLNILTYTADTDLDIDNLVITELPHGLWQNYDPGTDQVALPVLSRNYRMKDGPDATALADSLHPDGSKDATLFNVDPADWDRSKT